LRSDQLESRARRNRALSLGCVLAYLLLMRSIVPDREARAEDHYLVVITFGYGHLIGAAVFGRRHIRRSLAACGSPALAGASLLCGAAVLFFAYVWTLHRVPLLLGPLLGLATWHTTENDLVLCRSYRRGLKLPALDRRLRRQLPAIAVSALILALSAETLRPRPPGAALTGWLDFGDVFAATTLYHLVTWLFFFFDRISLGLSPPRTLLPLAGVHLGPALLCAAALLLPPEHGANLRALVFSPSIYLFWSMLHVAQTLLTREVGDSNPATTSQSSGPREARQLGNAATNGSMPQ